MGRRKDGSVFPIELSISAFTSGDGRYFSAIVRDITARKQAEQALRRHTIALERSNKELDDFAYIASHDLKEPLRGIHNHARFLLEDNAEKLDQESAGRLGRLVFLSQRMERLVNELLYFSRLGRQELAIQPTDLGAVVKDIESTLDHFLQERGARILLPAPLPVVTCDRPRVTELLRNLITNAVKYNDKQDKLIEIGVLKSKEDGDGRPVFFVKDNGLGIAPEFHQDIFRIFKRLQASKDPQEGTGVGLTFVKKIVERHGGEIWLESRPAKGTIFYFTLEAPPHDSKPESKAA
jgi:light-regulated signal transduction histidine kinase (bacteriophytochrome)